MLGAHTGTLLDGIGESRLTVNPTALCTIHVRCLSLVRNRFLPIDKQGFAVMIVVVIVIVIIAMIQPDEIQVTNRGQGVQSLPCWG